MLSINAEYKRRQTNEDGITEIVFTVPGIASQRILEDMKKTEYRLQLSEVRSKRSIQQNNLLWALIDDIARKTDNDPEDVYIHLLEKANAKYEYIACLPEAEPSLKASFRTIKLMNSFEHNGKTFNQYKVYTGSSKMNTQEMGILLDETIKLAAEYGIYTEVIYEQ